MPTSSLLPLPKWHIALALVFLTVFFALNVHSLHRMSPTTDEEKHYLYGENILKLNSERFDDSKMPFSAFNALPKKLSGPFPAGAIRTFLQELSTARLITVFFSMGVALLVHHWTRELYGNHAGLLALFLYTWDPNIIAHSMLVTTDVYALGMMLFSLYCFWKFLNQPSWKTGLLSAFVLGLSQLAKYTSVFLYPLFLMIVVVFFAPQWLAALREKAYPKFFRYLGHFARFSLLFLLVSLLVINVGFLFNRTFTPLPAYHFDSTLFQSLQEKLSALGDLPVPVPYPYLQGLDMVRYRERSGFGYGRLYLFGELRESGGFPGYYFYATLLKMPIATQLTLLTAFVIYLRRFTLQQFRQNEQFLLLPALFFIIYFNFFYGAQIGIRFFIVVFPLGYILSGKLVQHWAQVTNRQKIFGGVLAVYLVASVLSYHPHYIPYFNELVWDRRFAYKFLANADVDWEQADYYLEEYLAEHPNARVEPLHARDGLTIVSVNALVGAVGDRNQFAWLRDNFEPDATIGYMYLVYFITTPEYRQVFPEPVP